MTLAVGTRVRVAARDHLGHHRTPRYLKGRIGDVVAVHGAYRDPERLAYHVLDAPKRLLVRVRFDPRALFPGYRGGPFDLLEADLFEHWLEKA